MRHFVPALVLLAVLLPAASRAGDEAGFDQFRIPDHHGRQIDASLQLNLSRTSSQVPAEWTTNSQQSPVLDVAAQWIHDRDDFQLDYSLRGIFQGNWSTSSDETATPGVRLDRSDIRGARAQEFLQGGAAMRSYRSPLPVSTDLQLSGTITDGQIWSRDRNLATIDNPPGAPDRYLNVGSESEWDYYENVVGSAGLGWGRVRDASGVYAAWILEQRWLRNGTLTRPLSPAARSKFAQLLSIEGDYGLVHDLPDKAFWRDVESLLREDGALRGDRLDAYGSGLARDRLEPPSTLGVTRLVGALVEPFVQLQHEHEYTRQDYASTSSTSLGGGPYTSTESRGGDRALYYTERPVAGLSAEYHRPYGFDGQIDCSAQASADVRGLRRDTHLQFMLLARRWHGERWLTGAVFTQIRDVSRIPPVQDSWSSRGTVAASYYLEDHWTATLTASLLRAVSDSPAGIDQRSSQLAFVVGWNRGAFDAPGLINPLRPLN